METCHYWSKTSVQGAHSVVETLYRNKSSLEAIFRIIDKDNSGYISLDEFSEACTLIKKHMPCPMTTDQVEEICKLMDLNKDGLVDLNEFLESFRMVDPESRQKNQPGSPELSAEQPGTTSSLQERRENGFQEKEVTSQSPNGSAMANGSVNVDAVDQASNVKVQIHSPPKEGSSSSLEANLVQEIPVVHSKFQMSPVLSSRRGSQI